MGRAGRLTRSEAESSATGVPVLICSYSTKSRIEAWTRADGSGAVIEDVIHLKPVGGVYGSISGRRCLDAVVGRESVRQGRGRFL